MGPQGSVCCAWGRDGGRGWLLPRRWAGGLGSPRHLCFGDEGIGPRGLLLVGVSVPLAMPSLNPTPSTLLIGIDWFFNVGLKVTSGMLSGLNGRLLVSRSPFCCAALAGGSAWLSGAGSLHIAFPTHSWESGAAGGKVTSDLACARGRLPASSLWLQLGGAGVPKPQTELEARRGRAVWETELAFSTGGPQCQEAEVGALVC